MSPLLSPKIMTFSPRVQALASGLPGWLEALLIVVLCWQSAGVFWNVFAPNTQNVSLLMPQQGSDKSLIVRDAFLDWYANEERVESAAPETYQLLGIIAGNHGSAVLRLADGRSIAVRIGDEIAPGVTLTALEANQITIDRAGVRQTIHLPQKTTVATDGNGEYLASPLPSHLALDPRQTLRTPYQPNRIGRGAMPGVVQDASPVSGSPTPVPAVSNSQRGAADGSASSVSVATQQSTLSSSSSTSSSTTQPASVVLSGSTAMGVSTIALTRGQLQDIIPNSDTAGWNKGLSMTSEGGIRVDDAMSQALFKLLQLRNGDILKRVNDKTLTLVSDINFVYQAFAQRSTVDLILVRGGATLTQRYVIANTLTPITLSRGQLLGIVQSGNIGGWDKGLSSEPNDGGILVKDANAQAMAQPLQLRTGDILKSINNQQIRGLSDISLFIQAFGITSSNSVDLLLVRNGLTLTQHYDIQL